MTIQELKQRCIDSLNAEPKDPSEREIGYSIAIRNIIELLAQIPQQEISDEEIEEEISKRYMHPTMDYAFRDACKWYREQLKSKQPRK